MQRPPSVTLQVAEVNLPAGAPPLSFHGYRRGRELGQGGSSQVFVCSRWLSTGFEAPVDIP